MKNKIFRRKSFSHHMGKTISVAVAHSNRQSATMLVLFLFFVFFSITGCKKFVEVDTPTTSISENNVFTNDATAASVLTGIYTQLSLGKLLNGSISSVGLLTGLSGDELTLYDSSNQTLGGFYTNSLTARTGNNLWNKIYPQIYTINTAIEKVQNSTSLSKNVQKQLIGEAKFMRAFLFFYLVNLYGDVPLVVSTDYTVNSVLPRTPKDQVWAQIILDLNDAKDLLSTDYLDASLQNTTSERVRPTKWAAIALLARCDLFTRNWSDAEAESSEIINNSAMYHLDSLANVFLNGSPEAIWQLQPVSYGGFTEDAKTYIIHSAGFSSIKPVYLSTNLTNDFEEGDQRKKIWIDSIILNNNLYYFPSKYRNDSMTGQLTEYNTVLRLGEQYLIRAEARANQNNATGAIGDLNIIRARAGLKNYQYSDNATLLSAIYHERKTELFTEWGHRWLDLKRTQLINDIMSVVTPQKGGTWSSNWQLYPIPSAEILADGKITQNSGY